MLSNQVWHHLGCQAQNQEEPGLSAIVVNNRLLAAAGLCPIRFNNNGTTPPMETAVNVFSASAAPMTRPRGG